MKTISAFIGLFFFISASHAQEFAPLGARWTYCFTSGGGTPNPFYGIDTVEFNGDYQIINGINCKKLESIFGGDYYIYQDSNQVFYYNPQKDSFYLLYDFSIQSGEQFQTPKTQWAMGNMTVQIETRDTQWVNGVALSFFRGTIICDAGIWENNIAYNDRFGAVTQFLFYPLEFCIVDWGAERTFRSYEDPVLGFYMPDSIICPIIISSPDLTREEEFELFPNPVQDRLFFRDDLEISHLEVFDLAGNRKEIPLLSNTVNVENLPAGFYLLRIEVQGEKFITRRFVKY